MTMTLRQVKKEIEKLQVQASQLEQQEKEAAIETIKALLKEYNISAEEIGIGWKAARSAKRSVTTTKIQYRKGDLTWSGGRGVKPRWVREILEKEGPDELRKYKVAD